MKPRAPRWLSTICFAGLACLLYVSDMKGVRSRPCDPNLANFPPDPKSPKWRPGIYPGCLGGTDDAPGHGHCETVWCSGVLRITPDPVAVYQGQEVKLRVFVDGRLDLAGNATTPNGGGELDWGDGTSQPIPINPAGAEYAHVYKTADQHYPSARVTQDFKYQGNGSCSYRCDLRRAAVVIVYPALRPPHLHTVLAGESLSVIAHKYGTGDWASIYLANRKSLRWSDLIYPGQTLLVAENLSSGSAPSFITAVKSAFARIRGAELPESGKPLETTLGRGAESFGEYLIDKQTELQIEAGRKEIEHQIEDRLKGGARGVVVRVAIYSRDKTVVPNVEIWGIGDTPFAGIANGLGPGLSRDSSDLSYEPDESYFSFYSMENGKLAHRDLPKGMLTSGDADKIRADAEKEKESFRLGREIAKQMKEAQQKADAEKSLRDKLDIAKATAGDRQTSDEGPRSKQNPQNTSSNQAPGHRDGPERAGSGLPRGESRGNEADKNPGGGNNGTSRGNGLPASSVPVGGERVGQTPGRDSGRQGVPVGGVSPPPNGPQNGAKPDGTCCAKQ